jgi:hypothetical protein
MDHMSDDNARSDGEEEEGDDHLITLIINSLAHAWMVYRDFCDILSPGLLGSFCRIGTA